MDVNICEIRTFNHIISKPGFQQTITYDLQIPLAENSQGADFLGNLFVKQNMPLFAFEGKTNIFNITNF
jgi:hypothetical protein